VACTQTERVTNVI